MSKVFTKTIDYCWDCIHFDDHCDLCKKAHKQVLYSSNIWKCYIPIPSWCPLPDAEQEE
jgi:hypothetical protein